MNINGMSDSNVELFEKYISLVNTELDLIYKEQFLSAINYSNKINHYYFINKGKSFLEYVIEYCKKNT